MKSDNIGVGIMLAVAIVIMCFLGCMKTEEVGNKDFGGFVNHGDFCYTKVIEIEGHKYILYNGLQKGGIVHAESCMCKTKDYNVK